MFQPAGDYIFTVIGLEKKLVSSGKSSGSDMDALNLEIKNTKGATSTLFDNLIDTPKAAWKYDVFLKSAGVKINKGQSFSLTDNPDAPADGTVSPEINVIGLRGWCQIGEDIYQGKKKNIVACYYTDRAKVARVIVELEKPESADDAAFGERPAEQIAPSAPVAGDEQPEKDDCPF